MKFFVPGEPDGDAAELVCARFAEHAETPLLSHTEHVCSIRFVHNESTWTATVGELLSGSTEKRTMCDGRVSTEWETIPDNATVLAILGEPACYRVFTDAPPHGDVNSGWGNPILVHRAEAVQRFDG